MKSRFFPFLPLPWKSRQISHFECYLATVHISTSLFPSAVYACDSDKLKTPTLMQTAPFSPPQDANLSPEVLTPWSSRCQAEVMMAHGCSSMLWGSPAHHEIHRILLRNYKNNLKKWLRQNRGELPHTFMSLAQISCIFLWSFSQRQLLHALAIFLSKPATRISDFRDFKMLSRPRRFPARRRDAGQIGEWDWALSQQNNQVSKGTISPWASSSGQWEKPSRSHPWGDRWGAPAAAERWRVVPHLGCAHSAGSSEARRLPAGKGDQR